MEEVSVPIETGKSIGVRAPVTLLDSKGVSFSVSRITALQLITLRMVNELAEANHDSYYVSAELTWHKVGTHELINWELVALVAAEGHHSGISVQPKGD